MKGRRADPGGKKSDTSAYYIPPACITESSVSFPEEELHHLRHVLRLSTGARVQVLDGCGGSYEVELVHSGGLGLEGRIVSAEKSEPVWPRLSAAIAVSRTERMRITVEKLAELGCHRLVPLKTEHISFPGDLAGQAEKLQRVAVSALKQSRGRFLTAVENPVAFAEFLGLAEGEPALPVFCCKKGVGTDGELSAGAPALSRGPKEIFLVVGPEGGFSPRELELIERSGRPRLHLGDSILRSETAAVAGFVLLRHILLRDFGLY